MPAAENARQASRNLSGEVEKDVTFVDADHDLDDGIDTAYAEKHSHARAP